MYILLDNWRFSLFWLLFFTHLNLFKLFSYFSSTFASGFCFSRLLTLSLIRCLLFQVFCFVWSQLFKPTSLQKFAFLDLYLSCITFLDFFKLLSFQTFTFLYFRFFKLFTLRYLPSYIYFLGLCPVKFLSL